MIQINMNKGFESMIPRRKEEAKPIFNYGIKFNLFGNEFKLNFQVNKTTE